MKASRDATIFIDLSFLSPEEEAVIQKVLLRDEDLKKLEMGRVRKLKECVPDPKQLKELSGEWFEDLKSKRHGRQPHVSAVVRSSMRWKKSSGQRPNPFLKILPEEKAGEKNETHPEHFTDPRLIHPALSVQQDNEDEAIVLEVIEAGNQSGAKLQDPKLLVESPKLEKELKTKEINKEILDPRRSALKEDWGVETRPKQTTKDFEIRSFSDAQETSNWEIRQLDESDQPQSNVVLISSKQRTEIGFKDKQNDPKPGVLMNSGFGFEEAIQSPIPKRKFGEIRNITNKRTTPTQTEELVIDVNIKNNPDVLEDLKTSPVSNVNAPGYVHVDPKSLETEKRGKERVVEEIIVSDFKQKSTEKIIVDIDVDKNPDFLKGPVHNASKSAQMDPVQNGKERVMEEFIVSDSKQKSPTRLKELIVDFDVEKNPDILVGPDYNVNTPNILKLNQSLDPEQKGKERDVEEIIVADFKQRSSKRTEEINVKKDPGLLVGPVYNINAPKSPNLDPDQKGKERICEEIVVADFKQRSPKRSNEQIVDFKVEKNPDILKTPVNNVNTPKIVKLNQNLDPKQKEKERAVKEIIVTDFKRRSPTWTEEMNVDIDVKKDPDLLVGPVYNINAPKSANLDPDQKGKVFGEIVVADFKRRSPTRTEEINVEKEREFLQDPVYTINVPKSTNSDPILKGTEQVVEEIIVADFKRRSPTTSKELIVDSDVGQNPDILEVSVKSRNLERHVNWDQNGKEKAIEEILVDNFKGRSPTRTEELIIDVNVEAKPDIFEDIKNGPAPKSEVESESAKKVVEEIGEVEPEGSSRDQEEDEGGISDSEILASVYARATRPKMGVSKIQFARDPVQKTADVIPTIVIVPSESEEPSEMERVKKETPGPEVLVEVTKHVTDTWEDESVDSDGDSSSVSSQDSDISGKRGQLSASTLSVTERTASLLSVYSDAGDFRNVAVRGSVEFAIMYSPLGELVIMVEQCQDLAIANLGKQRTDPYVKTYLYPDKRSKRKTSIKKRTVNPVYVESLRYKVKREELHGKILNLSVWHNDSRGRNAFLGQVEIILKDWDWKHETLTWYNLQPKNADNQESQECRGILFISLKYISPEATGGSRVSRPTGEIHIWLREAKNLRRLKAQGVDSFVKCYMLPDTSKRVVRRPVW
ncbi:hypothetical protein HF521_021145 [Silurus meridionalis]|uniref:Synaptotagmin-like protein 2 n=1 Tax=Silurus meridionalis TaxID=175797 RepID=A0A8T0BD59_SILME|nr:hypothetical protein HF521_021145 [Silurus meridionalis]